MKKSILFIVLLLSGISTQMISQTVLVKNNKPTSRILLAVDDDDSKTAAYILQTFIERISGAKLPISTSAAAAKKNDIIIDNSQKNHPSINGVSITEDGFYISSKENILRIVAGEGRGAIYGVVTLLEDYFGVDYFGENEYAYEKQHTLSIPLIDKIDNPAFHYRQTQSYAMRTDSLYKLWHRIEEPREVFANSYWVHTFDKLLPSAEYGEEHPEYYSYFKGKRHPGKASQWCLTNPEVFEIVAQRIDSIFKANPDKNTISVSQNDGNYTNCTCDACRAIDEHEGAFSGSLITFLNKLAARFPDKQFSTLAYLYTMNPPKHIKSLPNVNIMLCDIDCMREVSLTENESGREFMKAMVGWSGISNNIFVWDYGINFDNFVAPFPNFHILQDNIRLFKAHNAQMHFSQIGGSRGGDFPELRAYLVAKLMWNPEVNVDSLMIHFLDGYYGEAGHSIYQYIKMMQGALIASGVPLWIYDSPVTHKNGMLKPELMRRYNKLWNQAEKAVANKEPFLKRVLRSRLPLLYSELEIARTENDKDLDDINNKLDYFEKKVKEFNVPTLNERNNSPVEYCELYRERYMPRQEKSIALGAQVIYEIEPTGKYKEVGKRALTDGLFGGSTFVESWVGWEGIDGTFVVDLGKNKDFHSVETDFLHQLGQWILFPLQLVYSYSQDGEDYTHWKTHVLPEDRSVSVKFKGVKSESARAINARYIKVEVVGTKVCPTWHYGVGHPSWFFIDEVTVL